MIPWLMSLVLLGLGVYTLGAAIAHLATLSLLCVREGGVVSCELRWKYPFGIVHTNRIPRLRSVTVDSRPLPRSRSAHFLVLSADEPSWPFAAPSIRMTRDSALAAASRLERFLREAAPEEIAIELRERSLWLALTFVALGAIGCGPFVYAVSLQIRS